MFDYLVIGHLTADLQEDGSVCTGGTALYAALTAYQLGATVAILTTAAPDLDRTILPSDIAVMLLPAGVSTTFRNTYHDNIRTQFMYHRAPPLTEEELTLAPPARVVHLGPVANEVPPVVPAGLSERFVGLTAQGLLRSVGPDRQVLTDPTLLRRLPFTGIDAMVLSEEDVNFDEDSVFAATKRVPIVALTRAERGATIWYRSERFEVPAYTANVVDPTGAGDVFATAFFLALEAGEDPVAAAGRACAAASCVIEGIGVETLPTRAAVEARMARG
jgi:sugar/nucleoside kinase (ribokinase family)